MPRKKSCKGDSVTTNNRKQTSTSDDLVTQNLHRPVFKSQQKHSKDIQYQLKRNLEEIQTNLPEISVSKEKKIEKVDHWLGLDEEILETIAALDECSAQSSDQLDDNFVQMADGICSDEELEFPEDVAADGVANEK